MTPGRLANLEILYKTHGLFSREATGELLAECRRLREENTALRAVADAARDVRDAEDARWNKARGSDEDMHARRKRFDLAVDHLGDVVDAWEKSRRHNTAPGADEAAEKREGE